MYINSLKKRNYFQSFLIATKSLNYLTFTKKRPNLVLISMDQTKGWMNTKNASAEINTTTETGHKHGIKN